jgi:hypothetical protein
VYRACLRLGALPTTSTRMQQIPRAACKQLASSGARKAAQATRLQFAGAAGYSRQLHLADAACTARPAVAVGVAAARAQASTTAAAHAAAAAGGMQRQLGMPASDPSNSKRAYATASAPPPPLVLVKVGDGMDSLFRPEGADVRAMDRMTLLEALAASKGFGNKLKGVSLDDCTVRVVKSASMEEPTPAEEAAAVELKGATPLAAHAEAGKHLFVRVALLKANATSAGEYSDRGMCGCSCSLVHTDWAPFIVLAVCHFCAPPSRSPHPILRMPLFISWLSDKRFTRLTPPTTSPLLLHSSPTRCLVAGRWFPDRTDNIDVTDPTLVRRKETCAMVFSGLAEQPVRLLRSPPGSGKTALGELLVASAPPGRTVKMLNANAFVRMGEGTTVEQLWAAKMGGSMAEALDPTQGPLRTYIIDEVQLLYALGADSSFWRAVKEVASTDPNKCKVQLLLMGTYGLQGGKLVGTPIELRSPWSLQLLLLDEAEISELFGAFNMTCRAHGYPAVSRSLQLAMERVCGRHVGLLRAALRLFMIAFKGVGAVTRDQEAEFTASQLVSMGRGSDLRALPRLASVSTDEKAILVQVALAGHHGLRLEGAELTVPPRLVSAGILDVESPGPGQPDVLRFPSPAMRAHALFNLGVRPELALPAEVLSDPAVFVRAAVKRMRSSELAGSLSKAGSSFAATGKGAAAALKTSLLERQYQMSFYR